MSIPQDELNHWADLAAKRSLAANKDAEVYTCAAGITPSGVVHVGNFREIITVDLVVRALRDRGVEVRFIYSWDDFDVFRKVPKGMPQPEMLTENLRRSIAAVPDPYGEHDSYATHNIETLESSLAPLAIDPEFIRQSKRYQAGDYAEGMKKALEHTDTIRKILDAHRKTPLAESWLPLSGFCSKCGRDEIDLNWEAGYEVDVHCRSCDHDETVDLREGGQLKLPWRVDWPMRWAEEGVLFEPGGKDHSSAGGSYDTGCEIAKQVYDWEAPQYVAYDFIGTKGTGGKISSSAGGVITVATCLEVYQPELLRWIFASYRPNTEFSISFDLDVIKIYEDYDRAIRLAHQADDGGKKDKKRKTARRTLQFASTKHARIEPGSPVPFQPSFRPLSMILQIYDGDIERTRNYYKQQGQLSTAREDELFTERANCCWRWIETYAPEEFCYRIRKEAVKRELGGEVRTAVQRLVVALRDNPDMDEKQMIPHAKGLMEGLTMERAELFPHIYDLLIARPKGPKLTTLIGTMGAARALPLLEASLE
jgi:lysyl-tRNA synthetase class 1